MYDAIIVGARCAGSATAMLLARKGHRVLLVDRATFPSDTMSTHYLKVPAVERLHRWGLLNKVRASGCPPIPEIAFDLGPLVLRGTPPRSAEIAGDYAPRRVILDKIMLDAAIAAGAEFRERFTVEDVVWDGDRVVGICGHEHGGDSVVEHAHLVIGADGMRSRIAQAVSAPAYNEKPPLTCSYYSYWSGVPVDICEMYPRPYRTLIAFPTNNDMTCIFIQWPHSQFHEFRADIEGNFAHTIALAPGLADRVANGRREERFTGTANLPNFMRKPHGPGWALVGDAGYHRDPLDAQGITDAFRDSELLASAVNAGLSGEQPMSEALAAYEEKRNAAVLPFYEFTCGLATLEPPSLQMQQLLGALYGNQEDTNQFLGVLENAVPVEEFFAPTNVERIMSKAAMVALA